MLFSQHLSESSKSAMLPPLTRRTALSDCVVRVRVFGVVPELILYFCESTRHDIGARYLVAPVRRDGSDVRPVRVALTGGELFLESNPVDRGAVRIGAAKARCLRRDGGTRRNHINIVVEVLENLCIVFLAPRRLGACVAREVAAQCQTFVLQTLVDIVKTLHLRRVPLHVSHYGTHFVQVIANRTENNVRSGGDQ